MVATKIVRALQPQRMPKMIGGELKYTLGVNGKPLKKPVSVARSDAQASRRRAEAFTQKVFNKAQASIAKQAKTATKAQATARKANLDKARKLTKSKRKAPKSTTAKAIKKAKQAPKAAKTAPAKARKARKEGNNITKAQSAKLNKLMDKLDDLNAGISSRRASFNQTKLQGFGPETSPYVRETRLLNELLADKRKLTRAISNIRKAI